MARQKHALAISLDSQLVKRVTNHRFQRGISPFCRLSLRGFYPLVRFVAIFNLVPHWQRWKYRSYLMPERKKRVLVVDDFEKWRQCACAALQDIPELVVVGEACDRPEATEKTTKLRRPGSLGHWA